MNTKALAIKAILNDVDITSSMDDFFVDKLYLHGDVVDHATQQPQGEPGKVYEDLQAKIVTMAKQSLYYNVWTTTDAVYGHTTPNTHFVGSDPYLEKNPCGEDVLPEIHPGNELKPSVNPITGEQDYTLKSYTVKLDEPVKWSFATKEPAFSVDVPIKPLKTKYKKKTTAADPVTNYDTQPPVDTVKIARHRKSLEFHVLQPGSDSQTKCKDTLLQVEKKWDVLSPQDVATVLAHFKKYICPDCLPHVPDNTGA